MKRGLQPTTFAVDFKKREVSRPTFLAGDKVVITDRKHHSRDQVGTITTAPRRVIVSGVTDVIAEVSIDAFAGSSVIVRPNQMRKLT